jgi:hypothetical protein
MTGLLLGTLVTSCGSATDADPGGSEDAAYVEVLRLINGTAPQVNAAEFIEYDVYREGYTRCMREAGFEYPQRPFNPPEKEADVSVRLGTEWLEPPADDLDVAEEKVAHRLDSRDWKGSPYFDLSADEQRDYDAALDACIKHESSWTVSAVPDSAYVLHMALRSLIEDIESELDTGGYGPCMEEQGFAVRSYSELYNFVWTSMPPVSQAPPSIEGGDAEWQKAVALERTAAQADWHCRSDIYADGVERLTSELPSFESRFAEQLSAVRDDWADVLVEADERSQGGFCGACRVSS